MIQLKEVISITICLVQENVSILVINGGSCRDIASTCLVSKHHLETKHNPKPYKLQWINDRF